MEYDKRIICYFDILGFSSIVCNKILDSSNIERLFTDISNIIEKYSTDNINISHFSDSFVVSIRYRTNAPTQLRFIFDILEKLLEFKLLARGAIVFGEIQHYDNNIFGPALVKAVYLEKKAKYPRVVLDESLDELPLPTIGKTSITYREYFNDFQFVKKDSIDNVFYIDLLGELKNKNKLTCYLADIKSLISAGLQEEALREKYLWLQEKLNLINN